MPFTVLAVIVLIGVITSAMQVRGRAKGADLGWMSEQWLAEYRATNQQ